jgi:hypothetical protein
MPTTPTAHRAKRTFGSALFSGGVAAIRGGESTEIENGRTMWSTAGGTFDRTGAGFQSIRLPNATNRDNGTRNFTEAANHNHCRTRARFVRRANVDNPANAANAVDCQRWSRMEVGARFI